MSEDTEEQKPQEDGFMWPILIAIVILLGVPLTVSILIASDRERERDDRCAHLFARARTYAESTSVMAQDGGCEYVARRPRD